MVLGVSCPHYIVFTTSTEAVTNVFFLLGDILKKSIVRKVPLHLGIPFSRSPTTSQPTSPSLPLPLSLSLNLSLSFCLSFSLSLSLSLSLSHLITHRCNQMSQESQHIIGVPLSGPRQLGQMQISGPSLTGGAVVKVDETMTVVGRCGAFVREPDGGYANRQMQQLSCNI